MILRFDRQKINDKIFSKDDYFEILQNSQPLFWKICLNTTFFDRYIAVKKILEGDVYMPVDISNTNSTHCLLLYQSRRDVKLLTLDIIKHDLYFVVRSLSHISYSDKVHPTLFDIFTKNRNSIRDMEVIIDIRGEWKSDPSMFMPISLSSITAKDFSIFSKISSHSIDGLVAEISRNSIDDADACIFHNLDVETDHDRVAIRSLESIHNENVALSRSQLCFLLLVKKLVHANNVARIMARKKMTTHNRNGKFIVQSGSLFGSTPFLTAGLNGTGQIVGIGDTGLDESHCLFSNTDGSKVKRSKYSKPITDFSKRKVIQYVSYMDGKDIEGHGTHVAGTLAGSCIDNLDFVYNGHASEAKIAFFDMNVKGDEIKYPHPLSKTVFSAARDAGASIYCASWGSPLNIYSSDCVDIDSFHYENKDFLLVVSAGNDGYKGLFSVGDPAVAKNALTVGCSHSLDHIDYVASFSSLGPSFDMRYKPDVVAPGFSTTSAKVDSQCDTFSLSGTSMSAPAVAGAALQIRQYFIDVKFWTSVCNEAYENCLSFTPSGATIKAALIHSGRSMSAYYSPPTTGYLDSTVLFRTPDYFQGFGRVYLPSVLPLKKYPHEFDLFVDEYHLSSMYKMTYQVHVDSVSTFDLKVTLVWMDPPNSVLSERLLLNDLDLIVESPKGDIYHGNGDFKDDVNNVEQVLIDKRQLISGIYEVHVLANKLIKEDGQDYSLVITSPGYVEKNIKPVMVSDGLHSLNCDRNHSELWIEMFDHDGNGWAKGNSFRIREAGTIRDVIVESMPSSREFGIYERKGYCIPDGRYDISLVTLGANPKSTAIAIQGCHVYLNQYRIQDHLSISNNDCNPCIGGQIVEVAMLGSFFGIPYGWHDHTFYTVFDGKGSKILASGTLTTGIMEVQRHCLVPGDYSIGFSSIATDDDFIYFYDDDYSKYFGVEEYAISLSSCGNLLGEFYAYDCDASFSKCSPNYQRMSFKIYNQESCRVEVHSPLPFYGFSDFSVNISDIMLRLALSLIISCMIFVWVIRKSILATNSRNQSVGFPSEYTAIEIVETNIGEESSLDEENREIGDRVENPMVQAGRIENTINET